MDEIRAKPTERLPDLRLPSAAGGGAPVPLVPSGGRRVPVIVAVHSADCGGCLAYAQALAVADAELREWDAHVVIVVPGSVEQAARFADDGLPFPVAADEARKLWMRLGMRGAVAIVADPWGEVRMRHVAGAAHDLPTPAEIVDWARFVAIQCPECEGEAW
jgi:peroxiredoxin